MSPLETKAPRIVLSIDEPYDIFHHRILPPAPFANQASLLPAKRTLHDKQRRIANT